MAHRQRMTIAEHDRIIETGGPALQARLARPENVRSIILLAHDAASHRYSPYNRYLAYCLQTAGFATLSADLLSYDEQRQDTQAGPFRLDIWRLADRLDALAEWTRNEPRTKDLQIGYFGVGIGATAALVASLQRPGAIAAVVCQNGEIDLASNLLGEVKPAVLLIVGVHHHTLRRTNERAARELHTEHRLVTVPEASALLPKDGALDIVIRHARTWFARHMHAWPSPHETVSAFGLRNKWSRN